VKRKSEKQRKKLSELLRDAELSTAPHNFGCVVSWRKSGEVQLLIWLKLAALVLHCRCQLVCGRPASSACVQARSTRRARSTLTGKPLL